MREKNTSCDSHLTSQLCYKCLFVFGGHFGFSSLSQMPQVVFTATFIMAWVKMGENRNNCKINGLQVIINLEYLFQFLTKKWSFIVPIKQTKVFLFLLHSH